jgi:hypothetical protein
MSILNRINIFMMDGNLIKMKCVCAGSELIVQSLKDNKFKLSVPCILCPSAHSFTLSSNTFFQKDLFPFSCKFTAVDICYIGRSNKVFEAMKQNEEELMKTFAAYEDEYGDEYDDGYDYTDDPEDFSEFDGLDILGDLNVFENIDDFKDFKDFEDFIGKKGLEGLEGLESLGGLNIFDDLLKQEEKEPGFILHRSGDSEPDKPKAANTDIKNAANENIDTAGHIPIQLQSYQITGQILDSLSRLCEEKKIFCECSNFDGKIVLAGNAVHIECKNCGSYRDIRSTNSADADYLSGVDELYLDFDG